MHAPADRWSTPPLECDIVMKGGITSGVVYPGAVVRLAERYRFRSIGGASAGAIAAVAVAAAEFGRASGGGFARLDRVPAELAAPVAGAPFLLRLFHPEPGTRRLFEAVLAFLRFGAFRGVLRLVRSFWRFPAAAAAVAGLAVALAAWGDVRWGLAIAVLAVAPWVAVVGVLRDAAAAFGAVASNDFGLCRLGPASVGSSSPALTEWLHQVIQEASGRPLDRPLTFADLWGVRPVDGGESREELAARDRDVLRRERDPRQRQTDLQVMTTNLTNGRPMRLPIVRDPHTNVPDDGGGLLFDPEELRRFFPEAVVDHMVARSAAAGPETGAAEARRELRVFPGGADLPVLVAARMSLSFPVLISAIPLWRVRPGPPLRLMRVVCSDGGISSNFPVHFFDTPLPTRPTFALDLAGFPRDERPDPDVPRENVDDPAPVDGEARESWRDIESMSSFFLAIKDAAQNWRDNAQARLPGFRDRVVRIKLARGEGGLNLALDDAKIQRLTARGAFAGGRLMTLFSGDGPAPSPTVWWNDHRFARFRVTMSVLEQFLRALERGYSSPPDAVSTSYSARVAQGDVPPFELRPAEQLAFATETVGDYVELVGDWGDRTLSDPHVPHPSAVLRVTPPV